NHGWPSNPLPIARLPTPVPEFVPSQSEYVFDAFKLAFLKPNARNPQPKQKGVAVAEHLFGFGRLFDGEMLRDNGIADSWFDGTEDLHGAVVVQTAAEE